jgi:hypothetical protein
MEKCALRMALRAGGVLLTCVILQAGEQVQFKGSTSVELPKPKRPLDDDGRNMKIDAQRPTLQGGFVTTPIDGSPLSNRKFREEMDKKKNWIFMNPYEQHFDNKTEEFMKGEKGTGLYDNEWMTSKEEKSVVQKFIEEKDGRGKESNRGDDENLSDRPSGEREGGFLSNRSDDLDRSKTDTQFGGSRVDFEKRILDPAALPDNIKNGPLDKSFERNLGADPFSSRKSMEATFEKEEVKKQQIAHEREFDQIINTRLGGGGGGPTVGRLDSLSVGGGIGQLNLNQGASRPADFGRGSLRGGSTATFTDGGPAFGGNSRPGFENRSFGEGFGVMPKAAPSYAPPVVSQNPASQRPAFTPAPFSLAVPQRKF